jgi:hypothetical protein
VPVFLGTFGSPTADPKKPLIATGIFGLGGSRALLAKTGDAAPDTDLATFASFGEPIGNAGTAFIGTVKDKTGKLDKATGSGIWTNTFPDADGTLHLVARLGSAAADSGEKYKAIDGLALNDGQNLFWTATLTGLPSTNRAILVQSSRADGAKVVLQTGDEIAGFDGVTVKSFIALREGGNGGLAKVAAGSGTGRSNGGAKTPVLVTFSDKSTAIFNVGPDGFDYFARTKAAAPDISNAFWKTLGLPAASGDTVAFRAVLAPAPNTADVTKNNATAIYVSSPNHPLAAVVRQGPVALSTGSETLLGFSDPVVNANGDVAFFATIAAAKAPGLVIARNQGDGSYAISEVARVGGGAPDLDGVSVASFTGVALPQNFDPAVAQGPVFIAKLKSGTTKVKAGEDCALFSCDASGVPHLLVRTGPQGNGKILKTIGALSHVLSSPAQSRAAASDRCVIYRATFTDKTQAMVEVPTL